MTKSVPSRRSTLTKSVPSRRSTLTKSVPNQWWVLHFLIDSDILPTLYKSSNLSFQWLTFVALLPQKLKPGSLVLLRNSTRDGRKGDKFQAWYLGPYKTVGTVREERFQTAQPATCLLLIKSVNACHLKLYRNWQWPLLHQNNTSLPGKILSSDILLTSLGWYNIYFL